MNHRDFEEKNIQIRNKLIYQLEKEVRELRSCLMERDSEISQLLIDYEILKKQKNKALIALEEIKRISEEF